MHRQTNQQFEMQMLVVWALAGSIPQTRPIPHHPITEERNDMNAIRRFMAALKALFQSKPERPTYYEPVV